jgi:hypothetical protein
MSAYTRNPKLPKHAKWNRETTYVYHDEADRLIFSVQRYLACYADGSPVRHELTGKQLKRCVQHWNGTTDGRKPPGARKLLYRLPQLLKQIVDRETIYVVEGENKAEQLRKWGLCATCAPEGAGHWYPEHAWFLRGAKRVVILPDNDDIGRQHADQVGRSLAGVVGELCLLELPSLPEHGDVVDWARAGGTREKFEQLAEEGREWTAYGPPPEDDRPEIASIEIRPGTVETYKVSIGGGVVVVDAEALNYFPWFNRACIAQVRRSFAPVRQKEWSSRVDTALRAARGPEQAAGELACRHGTPSWKNEPPSWAIRERIPEQGVGLLSARYSMYKSFIILALSGSMMTGLPFLGARVVRRAGVLIFAAEGAADIPMRVAAMVEHQLAGQVGERDLLNREGVDLQRLPLTYVPGCRPLLDPRTVDWMIEKARAEQEYFTAEFGLDLGLIGIDTMSAAAGWDNENDAAQCQIVMNHLYDVAMATGAFILAADHFGKDDRAGSRGSTVKDSSANTILDIRGKQNEDGTVEDTRLIVRKQRSGPQGMVFPFEARLVPMGQDRDGEPLKSRVIDWNVMRSERPKARSPTQVTLEQVLADVLSQHGETIKANGAADVRAARKAKVRLVFKAAYQAEHPDANADAVGEAFRRALRQAGKSIKSGTIDGIDYLWFAPAPF